MSNCVEKGREFEAADRAKEETVRLRGRWWGGGMREVGRPQAEPS